MWFHSLLNEIGLKPSVTPVIWCDNTSAVSLAANLVLHARVKHVELDIHFVHEKVLSNQLCVNFVPGCDQVADVLTKPLTLGAFSRCRDQMSVVAASNLYLDIGDGMLE
ncbi:hypothetical protein V6Z11_A12G072400 [Gossypium hirsutum]